MSDRHVVIVGLDGLRPDTVEPGKAPNLARLMREGAAMESHIAAFPCETRVNLASLTTGCPPARHGIAANAYFVARGNALLPVDTGSLAHARLLQSDRGILLADTLADRLGRIGRRLAVISTGSPGGFGLLTAGGQADTVAGFNARFAGAALPGAFNAELAEKRAVDETATDDVLTRTAVDAFLEDIWPTQRPAATIIWLAETDNAQHYRGGPGSPGALAALANVDHELGRLLDWRDRAPEAGLIDIVVVSDHGHVTVDHDVDLLGVLSGAGIAAARTPDADVDVVVTAGRAPGVWGRNGDEKVLSRVLQVVAEQDWLALAFAPAENSESARGALPGTLSHALVGAGGPHIPPLQLVLSASSSANGFGVPGVGPMEVGTSGLTAGSGMHGGLAAEEMRCLFVGHGTGFRSGMRSAAPSSTMDIAPTIWASLGLGVEPSFAGRTLHEILSGSSVEPPDVRTEEYEVQLNSHTSGFARNVADGRHYPQPLDSAG